MNGLLAVALEPLYLPTGWESLVVRPGWLVSVLGCLVLAATATLWFSWRERHALQPGRWIPLAVLRGIALIAIAGGIMGFERRDVTERVDPSRVVLLVDSSSSMRLPTESDANKTRSDAAIKIASQLVEQLSAVHEVRVARFGQSVKYVEREATGSLNPVFFDASANDTRLGDALRSVLDDQAGSPLAAMVVLSDGRSTAGLEPLAIALQAKERHTLIHAVGWGALTETPRVELASLAVPQRVFSGDRFSASALLLSRGDFQGSVTVVLTITPEGDESKIVEEQTVQLDLTPQSETPTAKFELPAPPPGRYTVSLTLADPSAPPLREPALTASLESVDRKTSVLLIAGGPTRDFRFLRDQLYRDDSFTMDVLLQSAMGAVSQDANRLLDSFPATADEINIYDAIVAFDPDWKSLGKGTTELLEAWVSRQGGGLLLVPGVVHAPASLRHADRSPLTRLSPVTLGDTLFFTGLGLSASATPSPLRLTSAGESADFMRLDSEASPDAAWARLAGFYSSPVPAKPKTGATVYAHLGEGAGASPLLVEQFYGSGRAAYLATGETWRLRREDPRWFTSFHTKLLRHLSQGRLLGNSQGRLFFDRDRYEVGETIRLRLTLSEGVAIVGSPSVRLRQLDDGDKRTEELSLTSIEGQPGAYFTEWPARTEGQYEANTMLEGETELTATTRIELPPRETASTLRDEATLRGIAEATGGIYYANPEEVLAIAAATPSRAETRTLLGPADQEFGRSLARGLLLTAIVALTIEWTLRRLWRLA